MAIGNPCHARVRDCQELGCNHGQGTERRSCNTAPCQAPPTHAPAPPPTHAPAPPPTQPAPIIIYKDLAPAPTPAPLLSGEIKYENRKGDIHI